MSPYGNEDAREKNPMLNYTFLTAGNAIFTVEPSAEFVAKNDTPEHYTFRIRKAEDGNVYFVSLLTGPDNTSDYTYLGILNTENGTVRLTKASKLTEDSWPVRIVRRVCAALKAGQEDAIETAGWKVHHEGRCGRCGRTLTVPESVESGIGPECARKMADAA